MTNEDYIDTQSKVMLLSGMLLELPLAEFLGVIDRAESVGPMLDPTLYRAAGEKLGFIREHATELRRAQERIRALQQRSEVR